VRHRHLSFSQLSPRQAQDGQLHIVEPDMIADNPQLHERFLAVAEAGARAHAELLTGLEQALAGSPDATLRRKQARQAARAVLPVATETRLLVTGTYRAWRHFLAVRASEHADVEIRAVAIACLRELTRIAPNCFADFEITELADGTPIASSPFAAEG
jgi:thymidylate synthase (FAD)